MRRLARRSYLKPRKARPRARRKGTRAALKRRCDTLWSLIIRASNGGRCKLQGKDHVRCGGVLQAAHCFGRGHHSVRHELWNGWPLCAGHHVYYTHNPDVWIYQLMREWGLPLYDKWMREAQTIKKVSYAAIKAELETAAKEVGVA